MGSLEAEKKYMDELAKEFGENPNDLIPPGAQIELPWERTEINLHQITTN